MQRRSGTSPLQPAPVPIKASRLLEPRTHGLRVTGRGVAGQRVRVSRESGLLSSFDVVSAGLEEAFLVGMRGEALLRTRPCFTRVALTFSLRLAMPVIVTTASELALMTALGVEAATLFGSTTPLP